MAGLIGATSLPIAVWAAHFAIIYGFTTLACARDAPQALPWIVALPSAFALAALAIIAIPAGRRALRFAQLADFLAAGLGALAAVAVLWEASPLLFVQSCA